MLDVVASIGLLLPKAMLFWKHKDSSVSCDAIGQNLKRTFAPTKGHSAEQGPIRIHPTMMFSVIWHRQVIAYMCDCASHMRMRWSTTVGEGTFLFSISCFLKIFHSLFMCLFIYHFTLSFIKVCQMLFRELGKNKKQAPILPAKCYRQGHLKNNREMDKEAIEWQRVRSAMRKDKER